MRPFFQSFLIVASAAICIPAGTAGAAAPASAESGFTAVVMPPPRSVTVEGQGEVEAVPDVAEVSAGVTARAETARQALDASNAAMARVMSLLRAAAVGERDIRTSGLTVSPVYERPDPNTPRNVAGYEATNQITVTIRDLNRLGTILDSAVTAGSNRVEGIRFRIASPETLLDRARGQAFEDAKRRAALYAEAAGARLGKVLRITEQTAHLPQPRLLAAEAPAFSRTVPVSPGTQELRVTISVQFGLE